MPQIALDARDMVPSNKFRISYFAPLTVFFALLPNSGHPTRDCVILEVTKPTLTTPTISYRIQNTPRGRSQELRQRLRLVLLVCARNNRFTPPFECNTPPRTNKKKGNKQAQQKLQISTKHKTPKMHKKRQKTPKKAPKQTQNGAEWVVNDGNIK